MDIPEVFGEAFLAWFREFTEEMWARCKTPTLEEYEAAGVGGGGFVQGTRWSGGLEEAQIAALEQRSGLAFPPDFRLYLRKLHCPDRPALDVHFVDEESMAIEPRWYLPNWLEADPMVEGRHWVERGLLDAVEESALWKAEWGPKPNTEEGRARRVAELLDAAPRLIPVCGHRFLVGEPCEAGNLVLSVWGDDIIVYGEDLRRYLLNDFVRVHNHRISDEAVERSRKIPFWGAFL